MKWRVQAAVVAVAILAEVTLGRAAGAPGFALFFGRFHPLVVHLPIGFFLLVALGEAATFLPKLRERVEPALGLLLPVSTVAALSAFLLGELLALEGGLPAGSLSWHRSLTLSAIIGMSLCWSLYERQTAKQGQGRGLYRGALAATLGCLSLGAHFGGTMTRGENYLAKYAPGPLKPLLGAPEAEPEPAPGPATPAAPSADPLVYQDVLQPLLKRYCVDCHGPEKQKGKLRLDSLEELLMGGENGPVLVPGAPQKSALLVRILLPASDDDHMPPEGKPSPQPEERALIEFWIQRGASPTLKVRDLLAPAAARSLLEHALGSPTRSDSVPASNASAPNASAPNASAPAPSDSGLVPSDNSAPAAAPGVAVDAAPSVAADAAPAAVPAATAIPPPSATGPGFLAAHCAKCHGAQKQKGKLRVDSRAALLKGGANGAALVPGSPDQSSLIQRMRLALGDEEHMPPAKEPQPTPAEIAALAAWIRTGAGSSSAQRDSSVPANTTKKPAIDVAATTSPATSPATASPATEPSATEPSATEPTGTKPAVSRVVSFPDAIQPLLREKCGKCHIKDKPAGGIGVAQHAQLLEGGFSGAGIVPKDRKASVVMQRITLAAADGDHMPPEGEPALSAYEIELIGSWIDQGAAAQGVTEVAAAPAALPAQAGGCAACSVPGAPQSKWLELQAFAILGAAALRTARRRRRVTASA